MSNIYVMVSNSLPKGVYKIGRTNKDPEIRAKELSSQTAAISPFYVVYSQQVIDSARMESHLHDFFHEERVYQNKEYFKVQLSQIIMAIERFMMEEKALGDSEYPWAKLFNSFVPHPGYENILSPEEMAQCQALEKKLTRNA